jgi:uncharacterized alkaline shock family protein YloU
MFTVKDVQAVHSLTPNIGNNIVKLFSKRPVLPVKVTLNREQVKLDVSCYIMTVQNTVHLFWINLYKLLKL